MRERESGRLLIENPSFYVNCKQAENFVVRW